MAASTPPEALRASLTAERDSGRPFAHAWPPALTHALGSAETDDERDAWTGALEATRRAWETAYAHQDAPACERALATLGCDPERTVKLATADGRICDKCGGPIPAAKDGRARYCSHACQRAANGRRVAAAV